MSIFCHFWIKGVSIQYLRHRNYTSTSSLGAMSSCPAFGKFARGRKSGSHKIRAAQFSFRAHCDRKTRRSDPEVLALVTNVQRNGPNMGKTCSPTVADKEATMKKRARRRNNDWHEQLTAEEFTQDSDPTPSMSTRDAIRSKIRV